MSGKLRGRCIYCKNHCSYNSGFCILWPRQESNLNLELRKLLYYPLYYEAIFIPKYAEQK